MYIIRYLSQGNSLCSMSSIFPLNRIFNNMDRILLLLLLESWLLNWFPHRLSVLHRTGTKSFVFFLLTFILFYFYTVFSLHIENLYHPDHKISVKQFPIKVFWNLLTYNFLIFYWCFLYFWIVFKSCTCYFKCLRKTNLVSSNFVLKS